MIVLVVSVCACAGEQLKQVEIQLLKTPEEAVKSIIGNRLNNKYPNPRAEEYFLYKNRDEIISSLSINRFEPLRDDVGVAFLSTSIGSKVIRSTMWLRKVDGYWFEFLGYPTYTGDDYYPDLTLQEEEKAKELIEESKKWKESNPSEWWGYNFMF